MRASGRLQPASVIPSSIQTIVSSLQVDARRDDPPVDRDSEVLAALEANFAWLVPSDRIELSMQDAIRVRMHLCETHVPMLPFAGGYVYPGNPSAVLAQVHAAGAASAARTLSIGSRLVGAVARNLTAAPSANQQAVAVATDIWKTIDTIERPISLWMLYPTGKTDNVTLVHVVHHKGAAAQSDEAAAASSSYSVAIPRVETTTTSALPNGLYATPLVAFCLQSLSPVRLLQRTSGQNVLFAIAQSADMPTTASVPRTEWNREFVEESIPLGWIRIADTVDAGARARMVSWLQHASTIAPAWIASAMHPLDWPCGASASAPHNSPRVVFHLDPAVHALLVVHCSSLRSKAQPDHKAASSLSSSSSAANPTHFRGVSYKNFRKLDDIGVANAGLTHNLFPIVKVGPASTYSDAQKQTVGALVMEQAWTRTHAYLLATTEQECDKHPQSRNHMSRLIGPTPRFFSAWLSRRTLFQMPVENDDGNESWWVDTDSALFTFMLRLFEALWTRRHQTKWSLLEPYVVLHRPANAVGDALHGIQMEPQLVSALRVMVFVFFGTACERIHATLVPRSRISGSSSPYLERHLEAVWDYLFSMHTQMHEKFASFLANAEPTGLVVSIQANDGARYECVRHPLLFGDVCIPDDWQVSRSHRDVYDECVEASRVAILRACELYVFYHIHASVAVPAVASANGGTTETLSFLYLDRAACTQASTTVVAPLMEMDVSSSPRADSNASLHAILSLACEAAGGSDAILYDDLHRQHIYVVRIRALKSLYKWRLQKKSPVVSQLDRRVLQAALHDVQRLVGKTIGDIFEAEDENDDDDDEVRRDDEDASASSVSSSASVSSSWFVAIGSRLSSLSKKIGGRDASANETLFRDTLLVLDELKNSSYAPITYQLLHQSLGSRNLEQMIPGDFFGSPITMEQKNLVWCANLLHQVLEYTCVAPYIGDPKASSSWQQCAHVLQTEMQHILEWHGSAIAPLPGHGTQIVGYRPLFALVSRRVESGSQLSLHPDQLPVLHGLVAPRISVSSSDTSLSVGAASSTSAVRASSASSVSSVSSTSVPITAPHWRTSEYCILPLGIRPTANLHFRDDAFSQCRGFAIQVILRYSSSSSSSSSTRENGSHADPSTWSRVCAMQRYLGALLSSLPLLQVMSAMQSFSVHARAYFMRAFAPASDGFAVTATWVAHQVGNWFVRGMQADPETFLDELSEMIGLTHLCTRSVATVESASGGVYRVKLDSDAVFAQKAFDHLRKQSGDTMKQALLHWSVQTVLCEQLP
jgi:hypothetical protein